MADQERGGIVNIDAVLPPDIIFAVGDGEYRIRGNIEARIAFEIQRLMRKQDDAREQESVEAYLDAAQNMHDYLLGLFQAKQPELTELPWDLGQMNRVAGVVLARAMGADLDALQALGDDLPPTTPTATTTRPNRQQRRSTRPTGSAR